MLISGATYILTFFELAFSIQILPDDAHLHHIMNFGDSEYKWQSAKYIEIEVIYLDQTGEELSIFFVLNDDEVDIKPDQFKVNR